MESGESWLRTGRSGGVSWSRQCRSLLLLDLTPYKGKRRKRRRSAIHETFPAILLALEDIEESEGKSLEVAEAQELFNSMTRIKFLLMLLMAMAPLSK